MDATVEQEASITVDDKVVIEEPDKVVDDSCVNDTIGEELPAKVPSLVAIVTIEDEAMPNETVVAEPPKEEEEEEAVKESSLQSSVKDKELQGSSSTIGNNPKTPEMTPVLVESYSIRDEDDNDLEPCNDEIPDTASKLNSDESLTQQTGLLGSVMKTDLGEILRRSCRERKTNTRFSKDSVVPGVTSPDGPKNRQKGKQSIPTSPNLPKSNTGHLIVTTGRVGETTTMTIRTEPKRLNKVTSSDGTIHTVRPTPKTGYMTLDRFAANNKLIREAIEGGKRLIIKRQDKARKSFAYDASGGTTDGKASSGALSSMAGRTSFSYHGSAVSKIKRKRFFKGSTYHLSHSRRAYRKKKKPALAIDGEDDNNDDDDDEEEESVTSEASSSARTSGIESLDDTGESSQQIVLVNNREDESNSVSAVSMTETATTVSTEPSSQSLSSLDPPVLDRETKETAANDEPQLNDDDDDGDVEILKIVQNGGDDDDASMDAARVRGRVVPIKRILAVDDVVVANEPAASADGENETVPIIVSITSQKKRKASSEGLTKSFASDTPRPTKKRKTNKKSEWSPMFKMPSLQSGESKKVSTVTLHQPLHMLCTCRTVDGAHLIHDPTGNFCQGIDCIDNRLIGCINTVTVQELLRPAARVPFQSLCEVHRQRMRLHQCCPGCGLFCTQGTFIQCRADPRKSIHHAHKDCLLMKGGAELCPHCGEGTPLQEVTIELNAPRSLAFFHKQHPSRKDGKPGARMAFSRGNEYSKSSDLSDTACSRSYKFIESGKEISSAGLPLGPDRSQLEEILVNLSNETPSNLQYTVKHMAMAAKNGDVEKILHMLTMSFDPNMKFEDHDNCTPLHLAAANGHLVLTHVLVQASASLDPMDNSLQTPLMFAIENGNIHIAQYLIKAGAQLDARGEDGMTVLHLAAKAGQLEACRLLLDTGKVNGNIQDDGGWTPLVWAAEHRHLTVVKFLLERGTDPNLRDNEHNIALHWSAFSGSIEISEIFLNHGCDINSANDHHDTPLHIAARQDKYECVMLFLARNADVDAKNKDQETPLMCCPDQNSQTWLALSMTKHLKKISGSRTIRTERILHQDISRGKEQNPIQCINGVDDEPAPSDFVYICENCETTPVNMDRAITSLQCCHCEDDCSSPNCNCSSMSLKCWYDKEGILIDEFNLFDPPMIFECNRVCRCWNTCKNRVLQHGITCRFQLFRTKGKGWGVRALRDIPRGTFICEYVGELISDLEADQREDDSYLFDLDNRDGETYCIDARRYGNISRFINHLCEPNVVPVKVFVDYQDLRFPRIALFSSREIRAYEELGFDYGDKFWIIKYKMFTCSCVSEKCKYSSKTIQETLANYNKRQKEEQEDTPPNS